MEVQVLSRAPIFLKTAYREKKLVERLLHHPALKLRKELLLIGKICRLAAYRNAKNIAFYVPVHGEVNLIPLFLKHRSKKKFFLPKSTDGRTLRFHAVNKLSELELGKYNIPEPASSKRIIGKNRIDLVLVPGLAFDRKCRRLGYGKGYYDNFLAHTPCLKIGIAYDFQLIKNIPAEKNDVPMDLIITEKQIIRPH